jgi:rubrerythrin
MTATRTEKALHDAYAGEAKAHLRLLGYAAKAAEEGYPQMARLFRAIAAAEVVHGLRHLRLMKAIGSTEENLKTSFESETTVSETAYPPLIKIAEEEGQRAAAIAFSQVRDAEGFHAKLYKNAIDHMVGETETSYFVCQVCGYVQDGAAPDECPVCQAKKDKFLQVD